MTAVSGASSAALAGQEAHPAGHATLNQLAKQISAKHRQVLQGLRRILENAFAAGLLLEEAKAQVPYGKWRAWVEHHCPFSYETSAVYRRVARKRHELPANVTTLDEALTWLSTPHETDPSSPSDLQPAADPQVTFPTEKLPGEFPAELQLPLIEPPRTAAQTELVADQKLLMVAATIRDYSVQDILVKREALRELRDVIDAALARAERADWPLSPSAAEDIRCGSKQDVPLAAANGRVVYRGPSLLVPDQEVVVALTGLRHPSQNRKTGPMIQAYVLVAGQDPVTAIRHDADRAICGDCALRGTSGRQRSCYVEYWRAPQGIFSALSRYPLVPPIAAAQSVGHTPLRIAAYGDPAAVPVDVWLPFVRPGAHWTGYTHHWRTCDPRFKTFCMASVETEEDARAARAAGWRTFRAMRADERPETGEVLCPASAEAGYRTTCDHCQLCTGNQTDAKSVAIYAHGQKLHFFRTPHPAPTEPTRSSDSGALSLVTAGDVDPSLGVVRCAR